MIGDHIISSELNGICSGSLSELSVTVKKETAEPKRFSQRSKASRVCSRVPDRPTSRAWRGSSATFVGTTHMTIPPSFFCAALLLAVILSLSACTTKRTVSGERIYFTGTSAYDRKLRTLDLSEQQAKDRVTDYLRARRGDSGPMFIGDHMVIVVSGRSRRAILTLFVCGPGKSPLFDAHGS